MELFEIILGATVVLALLWGMLIRPGMGNSSLPALLAYRYAHRGWHDKPTIPENSLPAFRLAVQHGFGAELDVHLTKDGRLAVVHDSDLTRVTGEAGIVEELTAAELSRYRLEGTNEPIPYLEQVLSLFEGRTPLIIELKVYQGNHTALCRAAADLLDRYKGRFCLESFQPQAVLWLKKNRPDWVRGQLLCYLRRAGEPRGAIEDFLFHNMLLSAFTRPDFLAYKFEDRKNLSLRFCRFLYGVPEFSWTIKTPDQQQTAEQDGCTIIFEQFDPRETNESG